MTTNEAGPRLSQPSILRFWAPLAAAWVMMAVEGPFLAAVIARLPEPEFNLAAYGVAYAFALLAEAPVIMMLTATTALVDDAVSYRRLRAFTYGLIAVVTASLLLLLAPSVFSVLARDLIALPDEVARRTYGALWILLPWPGAIAYRRFHQGLLIRAGRPRLVAYGTALRVSAMTATALLLFFFAELPGAYVGTAALAVGVCVEAAATRLMARSTVSEIAHAPPPPDRVRPLPGQRDILRFYYPLALTSIIGLAVQPLLTFFMGRAPAPVESLATYPVVNALGFLFRSLGIAYQEVAITLMGPRHEHAPELGRFAIALGLATSAALALVALTPLAQLWYGTISGLSPELVGFAIPATLIMAPMPLLSVLLSWQRGIVIVAHTTRPVTWASVLEVATIAILFPLLGWHLDMVGVSAATGAYMLGRLAGNLSLIVPCLRILRGRGRPAADGP